MMALGSLLRQAAGVHIPRVIAILKKKVCPISKCLAYTGQGLQCRGQGHQTPWGIELCSQHDSKDVVRLSPGGSYTAISKYQVYCCTDERVIKIGRSLRPFDRVNSIRSGYTGLPEVADPSKLQIVATRYEFGSFTESTVHRLLGWQDRIGNEWWRLTERTLIVLALVGLTWDEGVD